MQLQTFDWSLFICQSCFHNDGAQLYVIFQPIYESIRSFSGLPYKISEWESKGQSNEKFKPPYTANKVLSPKLLWNNSRLTLRFEISCLKQEDTTPFTPRQCNKFVFCIWIGHMVTRLKYWFYSKIYFVWSCRVVELNKMLIQINANIANKI